MRVLKLTDPGTPFLECFPKGLVTLPLFPEGKPVNRGETPLIDELMYLGTCLGFSRVYLHLRESGTASVREYK
jgi:hypothetical protein